MASGSQTAGKDRCVCDLPKRATVKLLSAGGHVEISRRLSILQPFNLWQRAGEDKQRDGGCVQERLWFLPDGLIVLMSTFDGIVAEFPLIQIDYFRRNPSRPPPLACFLSHVHSDHLQGLESFRAPFIYCSAATRELLLRIEKYPHRMNFNKGVLESRRLHYKHLYKLLRPIPLNTPTEIELTPRLSIRVTLFDANHCAGAVMFLIEGDGKAVLYTGDIRAESWWVNTLVRSPILIPYTLGGKRLDTIYLDTTFARADSVCHRFPSKADGLAELLRKVAKYPEDIVFYFRAWTFGYEEVWVALSAALNSKVHADRYQLGLYQSINMQARSGNGATGAPALCGYELGNRFVPGCLSEDETCRIHSCESEPPCPRAKAKGTVHIEPIVSRLQDGSRFPEVGIGGGAGDLYQGHELELPDLTALNELEKLCHEQIHDDQVLSETTKVLLDAYKSKRKTLSLDEYGMKDEQDIPLDKLVRILSRGMQNKSQQSLPNRIEFPYSRHSSYSELCELVSAFSPKDVFPCTTNPLTWDESTSIRSLFGHLCSGGQFTYDNQMRHAIVHDDELSRARKRARVSEPSPQSSQHSNSSPRVCGSSEASPTSSSSARGLLPSSLETISENHHHTTNNPVPVSNPPEAEHARRTEIRLARTFLQSNLPPETVSLGSLPSSWSDLENNVDDDRDREETPSQTTNTNNVPESQLSLPDSAFAASFSSQGQDLQDETTADSARNRRTAYLAARADSFDAWSFVSLISAGNNHTEQEIEL